MLRYRDHQGCVSGYGLPPLYFEVCWLVGLRWVVVTLCYFSTCQNCLDPIRTGVVNEIHRSLFDCLLCQFNFFA